jgi:hypothetical protein
VANFTLPLHREWREDAYKILATLSTDAEVPDCILINVNWNKAEIPNWVYNEYQITPRKLEFLFDDIERYGKINYEYNLVGAANNNHF